MRFFNFSNLWSSCWLSCEYVRLGEGSGPNDKRVKVGIFPVFKMFIFRNILRNVCTRLSSHIWKVFTDFYKIFEEIQICFNSYTLNSGPTSFFSRETLPTPMSVLLYLNGWVLFQLYKPNTACFMYWVKSGRIEFSQFVQSWSGV